MKAHSLSFRFMPLLLGLGLLCAGALLFPSCSHYDAIGSQNATNLRTELTTLMSKATGAYAPNENEAKKVLADLEKAEKHAGEQKKNLEITTSWKTLRTEQVEPFIERWKAGMLDNIVVKESVMQVQKSLDAIKQAEQAKGKKKM